MEANLRHICEVCGIEEPLTSEEGFEKGWDYPPRMGTCGVVSPRTCPQCPIAHTVWWALAIDRYSLDMLAPTQRAALDRILGEPETVVA